MAWTSKESKSSAREVRALEASYLKVQMKGFFHNNFNIIYLGMHFAMLVNNHVYY